MARLMNDPVLQLFADLPLQGPGSDGDSIAALDLIRADLPAAPVVADLGCGTGRSALTLARQLPLATVEAIDAVPLFIDRLRERAERQGLAHHIRARTADMLMPPIAPASLDLIWSEGAAYAVELENALRAWQPLLRPGGLCVLSECEWTSSDRPASVERFWRQAYPTMGDRAENSMRAEKAGFRLLHHRLLSPEGWSLYYDALRDALAGPAGTGIDRAFHEAISAEIAVRATGQDSFGYAFYILQRR